MFGRERAPFAAAASSRAGVLEVWYPGSAGESADESADEIAVTAMQPAREGVSIRYLAIRIVTVTTSARPVLFVVLAERQPPAADPFRFFSV